MKSILVILIFGLFAEVGICSGIIAFGDDSDGCYNCIKQPFTFPSVYKIDSPAPRTFDSCSWSIYTQSQSDNWAVIGRITLMYPTQLSCNVYLAFNHRGYFQSKLHCFEAITQALKIEGGFLAHEAFGVKVHSLRAREIYYRVISDEEIHLMGWDVKLISNFLGQENDGVIEYILSLEPLSDPELLAHHFKRLKAKL